jgi:transposase-like protein
MEKVSEKKKRKQKNIIKKGIVNGKQKYYNKTTGKYFFKVKSHRGLPNKKKKLALSLYLEGMSFRGISRIIGCCHRTVINWVYSASEKLKNRSLYTKTEQCSVVEMDEIFHFCGKKKKEGISG